MMHTRPVATRSWTARRSSRVAGRTALVLAVGLALLGDVPEADAQPQQRDTTILLEGGRFVRPDGTLEANPGILIAQGKIAAVGVGAVSVQAASRRVQLETEAVISPGLIELLTAVGGFHANPERIEAIDADANLRETIDPTHRDLGRALAAGVTTVLVGGARTNLVDGVAVAFRTALLDGELDVLREDGPLLLGLGASVVAADRDPSSRASAVEMLRALFVGDAPPNARIAALRQGKLDALVWVGAEADLEVVLDLLATLARRMPVVVPGRITRRGVEALAGRADTVVVGPYSMADEREEIAGAARLAERGLGIAFSSDSQPYSPETLRTTAALAVRLGLAPALARQALSAQPAAIAGIAGTVGTLTPGLEADVVVFSGDPLRLESRVEMVFVRGQRVALATDKRD
ncbi:MAG: amidohydrolase family protein [Planctomycetota bacterium]